MSYTSRSCIGIPCVFDFRICFEPFHHFKSFSYHFYGFFVMSLILFWYFSVIDFFKKNSYNYHICKAYVTFHKEKVTMSI